ncbi:hypothetical protein Tco_0344779 [Tanacetum coccineum]
MIEASYHDDCIRNLVLHLYNKLHGVFLKTTAISNIKLPILKKRKIIKSCCFADEVIYSLFAKQSEDWDLLHEDLEQIDDLDIEEMDIKLEIEWIAISIEEVL